MSKRKPKSRQEQRYTVRVEDSQFAGKRRVDSRDDDFRYRGPSDREKYGAMQELNFNDDDETFVH